METKVFDKKQRISIIGISGSGKSIFSRKLANRTDLPLYHMDKLFWKGNWKEIPENEYLKEHQLLIQKDRWIIEGYIDHSMANRLRRSDLVIFLDFPGWLCAWRLIKRWLLHKNLARPELPQEAKEQLNFGYLWRVLTKKERIFLSQAVKIAKPLNMVIINSPSKLKKIFKK